MTHHDTDYTDDASRAAFEAWYCFPCENTLRRAGDSYWTMAARVAWRTWQAATAAERNRWACEDAKPNGGRAWMRKQEVRHEVMTPFAALLRQGVIARDQALLDRLDGLVPANPGAWTDANGFAPLTPALLASIDALVGDVAVDLDAPLEPLGN